jgi:3-deoxy-D-manno-octulosonate 8-phosphate phosphatase (KDO 8-P phosphatase)
MDKLIRIKLLAMDVDGVLTDGSMIFGPEGDIKVYNTLDGLGIRLAMAAGLDIAWITGNTSSAVAARAKTLQVTELHQGQRFKSVALQDIAKRKMLDVNEIAYIGDDLNDLPAMEIAGASFTVPNAASEVIVAADYVTEKSGGHGAVREVIEMILKAQDRWGDGIKMFLNVLKEEQANGGAPGAVT